MTAPRLAAMVERSLVAAVVTALALSVLVLRQELLLACGHERENDIVANKVAVDGILDDAGAFVYSPDGTTVPTGQPG